ncbi:hypothetical protein ACSYDW_03005 [Paeniglutamicibacter sp. R2-26]|uniref:hypothetical protein n=1 Tax=Paeniglutamicibacter sp. R2-26 TaxID=3144417 RepID=UPI003EE750B7
MNDANAHEQQATALAQQAAQVAAKLKPGTWDSVQALATLSIAHSLLGAAERGAGGGPVAGSRG